MARAATSSIRSRPVDRNVLWVVTALSAVGVVAVYSAITFLAQVRAGGDTEGYLIKHLIRLGLAFGVMAVLSVVDYRKLARVARAALIVSLILLLVVKIVGVASGGARRWLDLGIVGFQPSDLARVSLLLYVCTLLAQKQAYIKEFGRGFAPLLFWILLTVVLIGAEDLSTAAVTLVAVMAVCFVGRVHFAQLALVAAIGVTLAYLLLLASPGRAARLESYVGIKLFPNTEREEVFSEQDEGFQARQAKIAVAMGGITGQGPGKSTQRYHLPAPYNDFIFAIIAEEYGMLGALALLGLFVLLLAQGFLRIARRSPDPFGLFLAVGLTVMLALYGFVHAGVSAGLLPVTGLPLPFVSYGGTAMITNGAMVGILLNISRAAR